ncbi:MAG: hypothetical protein ACLS4Z_09725 [Christensenellaceae bacterium]
MIKAIGLSITAFYCRRSLSQSSRPYSFKSKTLVKAVAGKCAPKYFLIAVLLQVGLFRSRELNGLFLNFLGRFGYKDDPICCPRSTASVWSVSF